MADAAMAVPQPWAARRPLSVRDRLLLAKHLAAAQIRRQRRHELAEEDELDQMDAAAATPVSPLFAPSATSASPLFASTASSASPSFASPLFASTATIAPPSFTGTITGTRNAAGPLSDRPVAWAPTFKTTAQDFGAPLPEASVTAADLGSIRNIAESMSTLNDSLKRLLRDGFAQPFDEVPALDRQGASSASASALAKQPDNDRLQGARTESTAVEVGKAQAEPVDGATRAVLSSLPAPTSPTPVADRVQDVWAEFTAVEVGKAHAEPIDDATWEALLGSPASTSRTPVASISALASALAVPEADVASPVFAVDPGSLDLSAELLLALYAVTEEVFDELFEACTADLA